MHRADLARQEPRHLLELAAGGGVVVASHRLDSALEQLLRCDAVLQLLRLGERAGARQDNGSDDARH